MNQTFNFPMPTAKGVVKKTSTVPSIHMAHVKWTVYVALLLDEDDYW